MLLRYLKQSKEENSQNKRTIEEVLELPQNKRNKIHVTSKRIFTT